jgi:predicted HTH domain antitoxin
MFDGGGGSNPGVSIVERRNAMLELLDAVDVDSLAPDQLGAELKFIRSTVDLLELQAARRVAAFDRSQAFYELGEHSTVDWMRTHTHLSGASADSQLTLARQMETLEPTLEAVQQGAISFEHALQIARQLKDLPDETALPAQDELLEAAARSDPRGLRQLGNEIRHREDPAGFARSAYRQHEKRRLRFFDHADGMLGVEGALPAPEGMKLRTCLESLIGIPAKGDERSQEQRQADALIELCARAIGCSKLPRRAGRRPQLTVIVRTEAGSEVAAELEGVGPISLGTLARLRGQDHVERRQKVNGRGVTLNFGRARRCHSEAQREDIGTRYATCVGGNCDVPIRDCEIHHLVPVAAGGDTDAGNGVPLCRRKHHPQVTEGGYRLVPREGGGFDLLAPPGAELRPDRRRRRRTLGGP